MYVEFSNDATTIYVSKDSIYAKSIEYFISSSFKQMIKQDSERIIHATNDELVKKAYLVKWVLRNAKQKLSSSIKSGFSHRIRMLALRIVFLGQHVVQQNVIMTLQVLKEKRLLLLLDKRNRRIIKALKNLFGKYYLGTVKLRLGVVVDLSTKESFEQLRKLLQATELESIPVDFIYSKEELKKLLKPEQDKRMEKLNNAFKVLNLSPNSDMGVIKLRYKKLKRAYHPDKVYGLGEMAVQKYTKKFQEIQEAYACISEMRHCA